MSPTYLPLAYLKIDMALFAYRYSNKTTRHVAPNGGDHSTALGLDADAPIYHHRSQFIVHGLEAAHAHVPKPGVRGAPLPHSKVANTMFNNMLRVEADLESLSRYLLSLTAITLVSRLAVQIHLTGRR